MTINAKTLRPGLLVSLKTSVTGGVAYNRIDLEADHQTADGAREARWETQRRIEDPAEFERATKLRGACRSVISRVCVPSDFGLLCPEGRDEKLSEAVAEARKMADDFNATAQRTRVGVYVLTGRVAQDDVEAARAIGSEMRTLIADMERAIEKCEPEKVREAAAKAKRLGAMLSDEVGEKVSRAVNEARAAARELTRRVEKGGELAATVLKDIKLNAVLDARFAFLDLDEQKPVVAVEHAAPAVDLGEEPAPLEPFTTVPVDVDFETGEPSKLDLAAMFPGIKLEL